MIFLVGRALVPARRHSCRRSAITSIALLAALLPLAAAEQDDLAYHALIQRARSGDRTVDYSQFRLICMKSALCQPRGSKPDLAALNIAVQAKQLQKAAEIGERLVDQGFVNVEAHATLIKVYAGLHQPQKSLFPFTTYTALHRSILGSGNGKTKQTAYHVITDREEYILLGSLGLPYSGDAVVTKRVETDGPHTYNHWEIRDPKTSQLQTIFFNLDAFTPEKSHPRD